jgi:tRNA-binding protein
MTEDGPVQELTPAEVKPLVTLAELQRLDIRVGTIRRVEEIERSRSLVRLIVGFGDHQRTILAGLKEERPDLRALIGQQALFVVNLEPKKMMGELSEGMLFDIGYADGVRPALAVPERAVPDGARAG